MSVMANTFSKWVRTSSFTIFATTLILIPTILAASRLLRLHLRSPQGLTGTTSKDPPILRSKPRTLRIQGVPKDMTSEVLQKKLEALPYPQTNLSNGTSNVLQLSLVPSPGSEGCATVTFKTLPTPLHSIENKSHIILERGLTFDSNFTGITPLYEGNTARSLTDVIVVPGLGSHPLGSWKASSNTDVWLRDFLPDDVPDIRVLLYGYDSTLYQSKTKQSIVDLAKGLLECIKGFRGTNCALSIAAQNPNNSRNQNIFKACHGLIFFGVPNLGLRSQTLKDMVSGQPNEQLVSDLIVNKDSESSSFLASLSERFAKCCKEQDLKIRSFYELDYSPTVIQNANGSWTRTGPDMLMVTTESARRTGLPMEFEGHIPLHKNHSGLVKFESKHDSNYKIVRANIQEVIEDAPRAIMERFDQCLSAAQDACLRSLTPFGISYVRDKIDRAKDQTLQWTLEESKLIDWRDSKASSLLWISGTPGQGKSVLCKYLLERLEDKIADKQMPFPSIAIYYFCYGQIEQQFQNVETVLRMLIVQLLKCSYLFKHLPKEYQIDNGEKFRSAPLPKLQEVFEAMVTDSHNQRIYCFIDALDELGSQISMLPSLIREIFSKIDVKKLSIKFLMTSRPEYAIVEALSGMTTLSLTASQNDIWRFIDTRVDSFGEKWSNLKPMIKDKLKEKAGFTYLWVDIVIKRIERVKLPNEKKISREIEDSPAELMELYHNLVQQLSKDEDMIRLLIWVVYARRPLSLKELETALSVRPEENCHCINDTKAYKPLITEQDTGLLLNIINERVYLIHQSTKDFFTANTNVLTEPISLQNKPEILLAHSCIRYLSFSDFKPPQSQDEVKTNRNQFISKYPFITYASRNWYEHIVTDEDISLLSSEINSILPPQSQAGIWVPIGRLKYRCLNMTTPTGGSVASELDIRWMVKYVVNNTKDPLEKWFPPSWLPSLAKGERSQVLKALLEYGEPYISNVTENMIKNVVRSRDGEEIMAFLFDKCKEITITENVLKTAAARDNAGFMSLLLNQRGNKNQITKAVVEAAAKSFYGCETMSLLLDRYGNKISITEDLLVRTAKARFAKQKIALLLDRRGDEIQITEAVLKAAVENIYNPEAISLLLDRRGDEISITEAVVKAAAENIHVYNIMLLLLGRYGDEIQITEATVGAVAAGGHHQALDLLESRCQVDLSKTEWRSVAKLYNAARDGDEATVLELLAQHCPPYYKDSRGLGPLHKAASGGHDKVVQMLLETGEVDVNSKDNDGWTPLFWAAMKGKENTAKLLLDRGADKEHKDNYDWTPLFAAVMYSEESTMKLLLDRGADKEVKNDKGKTPLSIAEKHRYTSIVKLLKEHRGAERHDSPEEESPSTETEGSTKESPPFLSHLI
ncbi:MAG: hypothetical protein M1834_000610 [Cirrosporium novae-zelandiae]|nr:MAG: hypothetical protein M1834_000610 [Cirrosporium novae-zelandiae]